MPFTRRSVLKYGTVACGTALAGCLELVHGTPTTTTNSDEPDVGTADWPQTRSNAQNTGRVPDTTAFSDPPGLYWTRTFEDAQIKSAPVAFESTAYVVLGPPDAEDDEDDDSMGEEDEWARLVGVDLRSGDVTFEQELDAEPAISPLVAGDHVYLRQEFEYVGYDRTTGDRAVTVDVGSLLAPPTLAAGDVYAGIATGSTRLLRIELAAGVVDWEYDTAIQRGPPGVVDDRVFYGDNDGVLGAVTTDGDEVWTQNHQDWRVLGAVCCHEGNVYAAIGDPFDDEDRYLISYTTEGEFRWQTEIDVGLDCSPAVSNGQVYYVDDDPRLYALDAATGDQMWTVPGGEFAFVDPVASDHSPVAAGDVVLYPDHDGRIRAVSPTGETRWKTASNVPPAIQSPIVAGNALVYAGQDSLSLLAPP